MGEPYDPLIERAAAMVGQTLRDKWHLDALIGVGGMASVFSATHRNGRRGAVKLLHTELSVDKSVRSRFLREGYVANKVVHRGTVEVLDDDVAENGGVFLVMELLDGENAERRWTRKERRLDAREVLCIVDQVLDVLAVAHEKEIIHRDIKPENVFITREGVVKLLDFGIARVKELSTATSATKFGTTLGTPAYMSPEQALGRTDEVGPLSDVWSVGALMYTLLAGQHVHGGKTVNEQLVAAATTPAAPIRSIDPDVPEAVAEVVDRALGFEKLDRWPDARSMQLAVRDVYQRIFSEDISAAPQLDIPAPEVLAELDAARVHAQPTATAGVVTTMKPETASRPTARPRRFKRWHFSLVGGLSLAVGGILALTFWRGSPWRKSPRPPIPNTVAVATTSSIVADRSAAATKASETAPPAATPSDSTVEFLDPRQHGNLSISARGGSCQVMVDGIVKGNTPVGALATFVGEHQITCRGAEGQSRSQSVWVKPGETSHVLFILLGGRPTGPLLTSSASAAPPPTAPATAEPEPPDKPDPRDIRK